ncbi:MAG: hypothetical protein KAT34_19710 [Candidatus Aminicenantes bacterium]|nr:hypothetical protein [Candidatus Aminicenantes bacterium]
MTDKKSRVRQVIVTVNGPGEISSWLYPFAEALKKKAPHFRVCAAMLPSVFRSGTEVEVLKSLAEIDAVSSVKETSRLIYRGELPGGFLRDVPGFVFHFGGEPFLSKRLASRLRYPLLFYGEDIPFLPSRYERIFLSTENKGPVSRKWGNNIMEVGNLMVDAARLRCPRRAAPEPGSLTIGLFPGSRFYQVRQLLPFFLQLARLVEPSLKSTFKSVNWLAARAEYITMDILKEAAANEEGRVLASDSGELNEATGALISPQGIEIKICGPETVMSRADMVITIPGTNTAELAVLGVPMLVLLPFQQAESYPMPGLAGHLHRIPLIGKYIKLFLLWLFWRKVKYVAYPNRKEKREIVPEVVGRITPEIVVDRLLEFLKKPFKPLGKELQAAMGSPGAAARLVDEVLEFLQNEG